MSLSFLYISEHTKSQVVCFSPSKTCLKNNWYLLEKYLYTQYINCVVFEKKKKKKQLIFARKDSIYTHDKQICQIQFWSPPLLKGDMLPNSNNQTN